MCIYIYKHVCIYVDIHMYMYMCIYIYTAGWVCKQTYTYPTKWGAENNHIAKDWQCAYCDYHYWPMTSLVPTVINIFCNCYSCWKCNVVVFQVSSLVLNWYSIKLANCQTLANHNHDTACWIEVSMMATIE